MTTTTAPVTLTNFTGVDFNQILTAVTAAAQVPLANLENQLVSENTAISVLGTISGEFTSLQSALGALNTTLTIPPMGATASPNAPFTATLLGAPTAGSYTLNVNQLASAQSVASQGYASSSAVIGDGSLTITSGGTPHTITIDSTNDTLDGVASAINAAGANVSAQIVNTGLPGAPYRLVITSSQTGLAQAFSVIDAVSGGTAPDFANNEVGPVASSVSGTSSATIGGTYTGGLTQGYHFSVTSGGTVGTDPLTIAYTSDSGEEGTLSVPAGYSGGALTVADGLTLSLASGTLNTGDNFSVGTFVPQISAAQDAQVQVGNQIVTSSTNQVTNAIPGLMLALNNTGGPATVNVAADQTAQGNQINAFVQAYNTLAADLVGQTQTVPNQAAPPLANDGGLRSILFNLQFELGTANLSELGISVDQHTGQLSFSQTAFAAAQNSDPTGVNAAISQLNTTLSPVLNMALQPNDGVIASETTSDQQQVTSLTQQITTMNNQLTEQKAQLQLQYATLQAQISSYQSLSLLFTDSTTSSSTSGSSSTLAGSNVSISA